MSMVVVTADVEDTSVWEERFRTHVELFKSYSAKTPVRYTVGRGSVAVCFEPEDLDTALTAIESEATAAAMAHDGVKRETVQIHVLDKSLDF